jgi:hypothetical protein
LPTRGRLIDRVARLGDVIVASTSGELQTKQWSQVYVHR